MCWEKADNKQNLKINSISIKHNIIGNSVTPNDDQKTTLTFSFDEF